MHKQLRIQLEQRSFRRASISSIFFDLKQNQNNSSQMGISISPIISFKEKVQKGVIRNFFASEKEDRSRKRERYNEGIPSEQKVQGIKSKKRHSIIDPLIGGFDADHDEFSADCNKGRNDKHERRHTISDLSDGLAQLSYCTDQRDITRCKSIAFDSDLDQDTPTRANSSSSRTLTKFLAKLMSPEEEEAVCNLQDFMYTPPTGLSSLLLIYTRRKGDHYLKPAVIHCKKFANDIDALDLGQYGSMKITPKTESDDADQRLQRRKQKNFTQGTLSDKVVDFTLGLLPPAIKRRQSMH
uniref:Uncharacterized protein n=2 Tax=Ditylum brightwellii TaxID=49249 RepID=A0A7S1ZMM0_9STRA|mmetsp:Transcript_35120/g.52426  ORF Transcript_35120/g.52426 Transcript_35120/m.52426 type:complete len:297 (+) Transcript_35120:284-1174(+)